MTYNDSMKTKDAVIALYKQGLGGVTIARKLKIHPQTVYYHLRNIEKPNGGRQTKTDKEEVRRLYEEEKLSCKQIADKLGLAGSSSVYTRLKNMGVKLRSKSESMKERGLHKVDQQKMIQLYQSGKSQVDIADIYNVTSGAISELLRNKYQISESNKGPRNPAWKGGITTLANTIRSSSQYISFRDKHFKNTLYRSELTNDKPANVNLHHVVDFSFILHNLTDQDDWQNCKHLWNHNNVIVLSETEHRAIHQKEKLDLDFSIFNVRPILRDECQLLLQRYHYLQSLPRNSKLYYGIFINDSLVGCCVFGSGANRFLSSGAGGPALELTRLCLIDWLPRNTASFFISRVIKQVKKDVPKIEYLVSFADPNVNHDGTVYKACNWKYTGQCKKDYMYQLLDGSLVHKSKFRCKNGKTEKELSLACGAIKVPQEGKHRYIYKIFH